MRKNIFILILFGLCFSLVIQGNVFSYDACSQSSPRAPCYIDGHDYTEYVLANVGEQVWFYNHEYGVGYNGNWNIYGYPGWGQNTFAINYAPVIEYYGCTAYANCSGYFGVSTWTLHAGGQLGVNYPQYWSQDIYNMQDSSQLLYSANPYVFPAPTPLKFPFANYSASNAPVSAIMDQATLGQGTPYVSSTTVTAFSGEVGNVNIGCKCYISSTNYWSCDFSNYTTCKDSHGVLGYQKTGYGNFLSGRSDIEYIDNFLYYPGHPGYDYPEQYNATTINAPTDGNLCVATTTTSQQTPAALWRDTTKCPFASIPGSGESWSGYHAIYIVHSGLYINGSTNDYMTVYLHNDDLESSAKTAIEQNGYIPVTKGQQISQVGGFGPSGSTTYSPHMHFEVYKKNGDDWNNPDRVDPYGDSAGNNILWERN